MNAFLILGMIFFHLLLNSDIFAQPISLTEKDLPAKMGTSFRMMKLSNPSINLGDKGENQYWDYSMFISDTIETWQVIEFKDAPYNELFPTANLVYRVTRQVSISDTIDYNFIEVNQEALIELGRVKAVGESIVDSTVLLETDPRFSFPVNYGDSWITKRSLNILFLGREMPILDSSYYEVDAWGKMKCSFGVKSCLRVVQYNVPMLITENAKIAVDHRINYYWVTNDSGILANIYSKEGEMNPNYAVAENAYFMSDFTLDVEALDISSEKPSDFYLLTNYPNPFNPKTRIEYRLAHKTNVILNIYNEMGQEVVRLLNTEQNAGSYAIDWDARFLPSGNYFIRLKTGDFWLSRKCLILK